MPYATYWRKPGGTSIITNTSDVPIQHNGYNIGSFSQRERHSFTCCHCNKVTFVEARCDPADLGGRCTCCDDLVCKDCVDKPCFPLEKRLGLYEKGVIPVLNNNTQETLEAQQKQQQPLRDSLKRKIEEKWKNLW